MTGDRDLREMKLLKFLTLKGYGIIIDYLLVRSSEFIKESSFSFGQ